MKLLLIHKNFPAQFRHVAQLIGSNPDNEVVFLTENLRPEWDIPGVRKLLSKPVGKTTRDTHPLARSFDVAVRRGAGAFLSLRKVKESGFTPDVILGHSGWGLTLFARDLYPNTPYVGFYEWFYNADGAESTFDGSKPTEGDRSRLRTKNTNMIHDLLDCTCGIAPTNWQRAQFPTIFQPKIEQIHDGIDTTYFTPNEDGLIPPEEIGIPGLDMTGATEVLTYCTRGFELYRGFPQFYRALPAILDARPGCHVLLAGEDRICYGAKRKDGKTYKEALTEEIQVDPKRVHFTGRLPYGLYKRVLQASSAHVYLTWPFVLSWSCLESMSCGCLMVCSDTDPVREVIRHGENGLLTDFHDPVKIADSAIEALERNSELKNLRVAARKTVIDGYELKDCLGAQIKLLEKVIRGN